MKNQITHKMNNKVLCLTSFPPRKCGIATYSYDLIHAIRNKFGKSIDIEICALETDNTLQNYPEEVYCRINTKNKEQYTALASHINNDEQISSVFIQHEFGLFGGDYGRYQ